jgi:DNA primase
MSPQTSNFRDFAQQILAAADIAEVVGSYVELKRAGSNLKGLCPFHQEKTPSFNVHPAKQIFKCFGCGKAGNAITFVKEIERVSYQDALRILAEKYRIPLPTFNARPGAEDELRWRQTLSEVLEHTALHYEQRLAHPEQGARARQYIEKRGLTPAIVKQFRLGVGADSWDDVAGTLRRQGYSEKALLEAGVVMNRKSGSGVYDYLRDRLIFPITNSRGSVIAFGGRLFEGDGPKYLNTAETTLFEKGKELYGLFQARDTLGRSQRPAVLVEGYMDVIACHQAGVTGAVASMGTSLTPDQARLIYRHTAPAHQAVFLYDADEAGIKAIMRGLPVLVAASLAVRVGLMPAGEDPDSYARENGAEALQQVVDQAVPFYEFLQEQARKRYPRSPEGKVQALEIFEPVLSAIQAETPMVYKGHITQLAVDQDLDEDVLLKHLAAHRRTRTSQAPTREAAPGVRAGTLALRQTTHASGPGQVPGPETPPPPPEMDEDDSGIPPWADMGQGEPQAASAAGEEATTSGAGEASSATTSTPTPVGATPPTQREKGLLRILIEHGEARAAARERLQAEWIANPLVRYWVGRILAIGDEVTDVWPALMESCHDAPEHEDFLHGIIFGTDEPLDDEYLPVLEHLAALIESDFRLAENRRHRREFLRGEKSLEDLSRELQENLHARVRQRRLATTENPAIQVKY